MVVCLLNIGRHRAEQRNDEEGIAGVRQRGSLLQIFNPEKFRRPLILILLDGEKDSHQQRHLYDQRQTAGQRVHLVSLVQFGDFHLELLFVVFVFILQGLHFRLQILHRFHRLDLFDG